MGMPASLYYSAEMVRALPDDGQRYEVVHGELFVTPAPRPLHQLVVKRLLVALDAYLRAERVGEVLMSPADISWAPDTLVQPDLFVAPIDEVRTLDWAKFDQLSLVIEVLSPSTARADRFAKRRLYQEVTIPCYWIVDADARTVEVWTPDMRFPHVEGQRLTWRPAGAATAFELELQELFRTV
jgi:Uma2 family endonuclease